jgi:hypothetical protein
MLRPRSGAVLLFASVVVGSCSSGSTPTSPSYDPASITRSPTRQGSAQIERLEGSDEAIVTAEGVADDIQAAAVAMVTLSGIVTDKVYPAWKISGATLTITPGPIVAKTTSVGGYTRRLRVGTYTIKIAKAGYSTATIRKTLTKTTALNISLTPIKPAGATARCKDRTWSKSQNRAGTCSSHKGVAYWVCPGRLCR